MNRYLIMCLTQLIVPRQRTFSSVQSLSRVQLCNPMDCSMPGLPVHHQLLDSPKPMSIESVMLSSHLILRRPLLLLPSILPCFRVISNESTLLMRWPKHWSFSFRRLVLRSLNILPKRTCKVNNRSR